MRYISALTRAMAVAGVQVVGGTPAIPPSLLYTDANNRGFLVNAGEGIQRLILESPGLRIANITDIITTRVDWDSVASVPGIGLFRRDQLAQSANSTALSVWGEERVRRFLRSTQLDCFADERGFEKHLLVKDEDCLRSIGDVRVERRTVGSSKILAFSLPQKEAGIDKVKLAKANIPKHLKSQLFKEGAVSLEGGVVIKKCDLLEKVEPAPFFVVLDIGDPDDVAEIAATDFHGLFPDSQLLLVAHFGSLSTLCCDAYRDLISQSPVDHLVLCRNPGSHVLFNCMQRNAILSSILPLAPLNYPSLDKFEAATSPLSDLPNVSFSQHLLKYNLYSGRKTPIGWTDTNVIKSPNFTSEISEAQKVYKVRSPRSPASKRLKRSFSCPELTFLGTTSTYSSTYRNVSGILLHSPECTVLLDAGELTLGQLIRTKGLSGAREIIRNLRFLFLSHIHFDHCGGTMSIARMYHELTGQPLTILCPGRMFTWLRDSVETVGAPVSLLSLGELHADPATRAQAAKELGVRVSPVPAIHTRDAWCVVLEAGGWKIAYSGDTMPNTGFISAGKDCDVLIHEATHQSSLAEQSATKRHSTVSQAIEVGRKMGAAYTILTHFSLRYQKLPPVVGEEIPGNVALAHDFMHVTEGNIEDWCAATPQLQRIFPDHYKDLLKQSKPKEPSVTSIA